MATLRNNLDAIRYIFLTYKESINIDDQINALKLASNPMHTNPLRGAKWDQNISIILLLLGKNTPFNAEVESRLNALQVAKINNALSKQKAANYDAPMREHDARMELLSRQSRTAFVTIGREELQEIGKQSIERYEAAAKEAAAKVKEEEAKAKEEADILYKKKREQVLKNLALAKAKKEREERDRQARNNFIAQEQAAQVRLQETVQEREDREAKEKADALAKQKEIDEIDARANEANRIESETRKQKQAERALRLQNKDEEERRKAQERDSIALVRKAEREAARREMKKTKKAVTVKSTEKKQVQKASTSTASKFAAHLLAQKKLVKRLQQPKLY